METQSKNTNFTPTFRTMSSSGTDRIRETTSLYIIQDILTIRHMDHWTY